MIFVTVGTHEQPFDRLIKCVDELKRDNKIKENVIIQTGYSNYEPQYCEWQKLYPYQQMLDLVKNARIVITHGGPSSFIMPLQIGKIPVVVPRQKQYDEHVNDHQLKFTKEVAERMGTIINVVETEQLGYVLENYDAIVSDMNKNQISNNTKFNLELEEIVNGMF